MEDLKVTRKVLPGGHGAVREQRQYREKLLAVRYRADGKGRFVKTVEIIICDRKL